MYRKKEDLISLIDALSMSERRHFTLLTRANSTAKGDDADFLKLFAELSKKSIGSDALKGASRRKQINTEKRLYDNILRNLSQYHHNGSVDITIRNLLTQIEILYNKALPRQCVRLLNKAFELSRQHEKFEFMLHLFQWERKLSIITETPLARPIEEITRDEQRILAKLTRVIHLENLYNHAMQVKREIGYVKDREELASKTIKSPQMPSLAACDTRKGLFYYHFIHALYFTLIDEPMSSYRHTQQLKQSPIQFILPNNYIDGLLHHVSSCLCLAYFDEAFHTFRELSTFFKEQSIKLSDSIQVRIAYYKICAHLLAYVYTGNQSGLSKTIRFTNRKLDQYSDQLSVEMKQVVLGNLLIAYVAAGDMDNAEQIGLWLFQKESKWVRINIYDDLYLTRLFLLLQNGMYDLLPSQALSAIRYFRLQAKNDTNHYNVELNISSLLSKEQPYENKETLQRILAKIKDYLTAHIGQLQGISHFHERYSFYLLWTESLLQGRPFYAVAADWHAAYIQSLEQP